MNIVFHCKKRENGFALLLALVVVLVLSTLVVDLSYSSRVAGSIAGNHRDRLLAYHLASAGIHVSELRLEIDKRVDATGLMGKKDDLSEIWWSMPLEFPTGLAMMMGAVESKEELNPGMFNRTIEAMDLPGSFLMEITDERAKINLNSMKRVDEGHFNAPMLVLQNLLSLKKFRRFFKDRKPVDVIQNLLDWIDDDQQAGSLGGGVEDDYYQLQEPRYNAKNGPFFTIAEIRLVKRMDPELVEAIAPFVTIFPYSTEKNLDRNYSRINVNTASEEVVTSLFDQMVGDPKGFVDKILEYRANAAFKSSEDFFKFLEEAFGFDKDYEAIAKEVKEIIDVRSDVFQIRSSGLVNDTRVSIDTVIDRSQTKPEYFYWKVD